MGENDHVYEEIAVLKEAEAGLRNLPKASEYVAQKSLAILAEEHELFDKAMALQLALVGWVMRGAPISDDGLRAAIGLTCYVFDMLSCGWNSLIRGFYAVALHSIRDIEQATITQVAVTLDPDAARKFWEGELKDGEASRVMQNALEKEDKVFANEWAEGRLDIRKLQHKLAHPGRTAINPSVVIAPDNQSAIPMVGGWFIEERCRGIAKLYAYLAFVAAVQTSQAFKTVLIAGGELEQRLVKLAAWGRPLIKRWEKELGYP